MRWNGDLEAFLAWFVSPNTQDEVELKSALTSVPNDSWWTVSVRLEVALNNAQSRILPLAPDPLPNKPIKPRHLGQEDLRNYLLADMKERLLTEENTNREVLP